MIVGLLNGCEIWWGCGKLLQWKRGSEKLDLSFIIFQDLYRLNIRWTCGPMSLWGIYRQQQGYRPYFCRWCSNPTWVSGDLGVSSRGILQLQILWFRSKLQVLGGLFDEAIYFMCVGKTSISSKISVSEYDRAPADHSRKMRSTGGHMNSLYGQIKFLINVRKDQDSDLQAGYVRGLYIFRHGPITVTRDQVKVTGNERHRRIIRYHWLLIVCQIGDCSVRLNLLFGKPVSTNSGYMGMWHNPLKSTLSAVLFFKESFVSRRPIVQPQSSWPRQIDAFSWGRLKIGTGPQRLTWWSADGVT